MLMHWFAAHLYVTAMLAAGILLLSGAVVVNQRSPVTLRAADPVPSTWGGAGNVGVFENPGTSAPVTRVRTEDLIKGQLPQNTQFSVIPIARSVGQETDESVARQGEPIADWSEVLEQLVEPQGGVEPSEVVSDIYSFIPRGLVSTDTQKTRTEKQQRLFEYGNAVGSYVRGFDDLHPNLITVLKNAYEDRTDPEKKAAAEKIGKDYQQLGLDLLRQQDVPAEVRPQHLKLAKAYNDAGKLLVQKLNAETNDELLETVEAYNASVTEHIKATIALVALFEVAEVAFGQSDPGSVFMFASAPSF